MHAGNNLFAECAFFRNACVVRRPLPANKLKRLTVKRRDVGRVKLAAAIFFDELRVYLFYADNARLFALSRKPLQRLLALKHIRDVVYLLILVSVKEPFLLSGINFRRFSFCCHFAISPFPSIRHPAGAGRYKPAMPMPTQG